MVSGVRLEKTRLKILELIILYVNQGGATVYQLSKSFVPEKSTPEKPVPGPSLTTTRKAVVALERAGFIKLQKIGMRNARSYVPTELGLRVYRQLKQIGDVPKETEEGIRFTNQLRQTLGGDIFNAAKKAGLLVIRKVTLPRVVEFGDILAASKKPRWEEIITDEGLVEPCVRCGNEIVFPPKVMQGELFSCPFCHVNYSGRKGPLPWTRNNNIIYGRVTGSADGVVTLECGRLTLKGMGYAQVGEDALLLVKPEDVSVFMSPPETLFEYNSVKGVIRSERRRGSVIEIEIRNGASQISIKAVISSHLWLGSGRKPEEAYAVFSPMAALVCCRTP